MSEDESGKGIYFDGLIHEFSLKKFDFEKLFSENKSGIALEKKNTTSLGHEVTPNPQRRAVRGLLTVSNHLSNVLVYIETNATLLLSMLIEKFS